MYSKAPSWGHSPLKKTSPDLFPAQLTVPFLEISCWLIIRSNTEQGFPDGRQTTPYLLATVPLLIVGNLVFNPVFAIHHTELSQSSELRSPHIEGSYQVRSYPLTDSS